MCKKQTIKSKNINLVLVSFQSKVFTKMCNLRKKKKTEHLVYFKCYLGELY